jgi:hypothetical protein
MMIDHRLSYVFKGEVSQGIEPLLDGNFSGPNRFEQFFESLCIHGMVFEDYDCNQTLVQKSRNNGPEDSGFIATAWTAYSKMNEQNDQLEHLVRTADWPTSRLKFLAEISESYIETDRDPAENFWTIIDTLPFKPDDATGSIPYYVDSDIVDLIPSSFHTLVGLLRKRYDTTPKSTFRPYLPISSPHVEQKFLQRRLCTRDLSSRPLARRIVEDAVYHNPYLDAGMLSTWFLHTKDTGKLLRSLKALYLKGIEEDIKKGGTTHFTCLTHLCIVDNLRHLRESLKKIPSKVLSFEKLDLAVGQLCYSMLKEIQTEVFNEVRYRDLILNVTQLEYLVKGMTNPLLFVSIKSNLLANDRNPYDLDPAAFTFLSDLLGQIDTDLRDVNGCLQELVLRAKSHRVGREILTHSWLIRGLREAIYRYLRDYEDYTGGTDLWLYYLFGSNSLLKSSLTEETAGKRLLEDLSNLMSEESAPADPERNRRIVTIENFFKSHKKGRVLKRLLFASRLDRQLQEVIEASLLYELDTRWNRQIEAFLEQMDNRTDKKSKAELREDYSRGILYRLATDSRPILQDLTLHKEGHLFLDLRGFTQRMSRTKEIAMADFMLKNFFWPVLHVAKSYVTKEGVRLNNFLGDALSFSGRIESLVALSQELRRVFHAYTSKVEEKRGILGDTDEARTMETRYHEQKRLVLKQRKVVEESIHNMEQELQAKEVLNPFYLLRIQEEEFASKLLHYQREILRINQEIQEASDEAVKRELMEHKQKLIRTREAVSEQKNNLTRTIAQFDKNELREIFRLVCADARDDLEELHVALKESFATEAELTRAYKTEMVALSDQGVEYGLFISYGDAAEILTFEDQFWGKVNVAIADKLNEAARGAGRSLTTKKRLEALLRNSRWIRGNPHLEYPFHLYIDKSYGLVLPPELSAELDAAVRSRNRENAHNVTDSISASLTDDVEEAMKGFGEESWEILAGVNDIYNLGEAISQDALQAYLTETRATAYHFEKEADITELHADIQNRFFFPAPTLQFVVSVHKADNALSFTLFRYAGTLVFKGFETQQPTPVYELLRRGSAFCQLLQKHHLSDWYQDARTHRTGVLNIATS